MPRKGERASLWAGLKNVGDKGGVLCTWTQAPAGGNCARGREGGGGTGGELACQWRASLGGRVPRGERGPEAGVCTEDGPPSALMSDLSCLGTAVPGPPSGEWVLVHTPLVLVSPPPHPVPTDVVIMSGVPGEGQARAGMITNLLLES